MRECSLVILEYFQEQKALSLYFYLKIMGRLFPVTFRVQLLQSTSGKTQTAANIQNEGLLQLTDVINMSIKILQPKMTFLPMTLGNLILDICTVELF